MQQKIIKALKREEGKIIKPNKICKNCGVKYHKTTFGLIKEDILIEKIQGATDSNLIDIYKDFEINNNVISCINQLKSLSWGRKV